MPTIPSNLRPLFRAITRAGLGALAASAVLVASACGGKPDSVSATLAPNQSTQVELHVSDVQGNSILSCTSQTIDSSDVDTQTALQNLSITVTSFGLTGTDTCTVQATVMAEPAAVPGTYRIRMDVGYTYLDPAGTGDVITGGVAGTIKVTVT